MRKLNRSGTSLRIIHYSMPKNEERFMYQDYKKLQNYNPAIELKGNLQIQSNKNNFCAYAYNTNKVNTNIGQLKTEADQFRKVNIKNFPNSKRTLVPELISTKDSEKWSLPRSKSTLNVKKNEMLYHRNDENKSNILNTQTKVTQHSKKCFYKKLGEDENFLNDTLNKQKSVIKFNEYSKYNKSSQITNLPGGIKRGMNEIRDDETYIRKTTHNTGKSVQRKIESDYKSNITCLPSSTVRVFEVLKFFY